ncbi:hypothetical protein V6N13_059039 [Hibiscus sabdariffa]|uniref:BRI1 kinase inhibitor 1 n=1 Tax=Hibiscus sabdariffa TaxID=183260 RepID=A0ABR2GEA3_9ROSI
MEKVGGLADEQQSSSSASASSSPSHEFSFTISDKTKAPPSSIAIDLTPADDIFFHGHLLPLHLLSHLPLSPRSSTNSLDSFTLPITELLELDDPKPQITSKSDSNIRNINGRSVNNKNDIESKAREKSKSFSLFSFARRQKGRVDVQDKEKHRKKKMRFDVSHLLKRYVRMVRPLLSFLGKRDKLHVHRQAYSFSGNLGLRNKMEDELVRGRRAEYSSAPASMRTSPTNSGLLVARATTGFPSSTSDSTMEELQAAIQAAIAHCKNSIRGEDKLKCHC